MVFDPLRPIFIAGPCAIESAEILDAVAAELVRLRDRHGLQVVFKSSFDKANRTSITSYRGVGLERGMQMLADIKAHHNLPITTDIHEPWQAAEVAPVADVIQIPAFLCRQTDLLVAAARTGRIVNIKKAQFLSGEDMRYPVQKVREAWKIGAGIPEANDSETGRSEADAPDVWLTERGNSFGYNNLVVDFRNLPVMKRHTPRVVMDCTHSVQRPGSGCGTTGGDREYIPAIALAAKAFGATGYFFETHPDPDRSFSDGPNMLPLADLKKVITSLL